MSHQGEAAMSDTLTDEQWLQTDYPDAYYAWPHPNVCNLYSYSENGRLLGSGRNEVESLADARKRLAPATKLDLNAALKVTPVVSTDCRYSDHASCGGEEPSIWPDGTQSVRKCSCLCHAEPLAPQAEPAHPDPKDARIATIDGKWSSSIEDAEKWLTALGKKRELSGRDRGYCSSLANCLRAALQERR